MTPTDTALIELLKIGLQTSTSMSTLMGPLSAKRWENILKFSAQQGILAIVYDAIQKQPSLLQPPKELLLRWTVNVDNIESNVRFKGKALEELSIFFSTHGLPMMVLKGAGLASLYPTPGHRPYGDIDIWLYGKHSQADELIRCKLGISVHDDVHHHTIFSFHGVMIENHFDFLNRWSHRSNREIEHNIRQYANEAGTELRVGEQIIHLPSPNLNALFLMRHMAIHFATEKIGLRHIADWAMFLRADGNKVDWHTIHAIYKEQNMHLFADAITVISIEKLGIECPSNYSFEDNKALQHRILSEILHPAFTKQQPQSGILQITSFKIFRWWANRWKHKLVYKDSLIGSFLWLCWAHILRPKTIAR